MKIIRILSGLIILMVFSLALSCSSGASLEQDEQNDQESAVTDTAAEIQTETTQSTEPDSGSDITEETVSPDIESGDNEEVESPDIESDIDEETTSSDEAEQPDIPENPDEIPPAITISIQGSAEFIDQTEQALLLLREKDITSFNFVQKYLGVIVQGGEGAMFPSELPPRLMVSDTTAFYSVTWYAGELVHAATLSELYQAYLSENGGPVPDYVWTSTEAEMTCLLKRIEAAKAIEAPQYEIDYLESKKVEP